MPNLDNKSSEKHSSILNEKERLHPFVPMWRIRQEVEKINNPKKEEFLKGLDCLYPDEYIERKIKALRGFYDLLQNEKTRENPDYWDDEHEVHIYEFGWQYYRTERYIPDDSIHWTKDYFDDDYDDTDYDIFEGGDGVTYMTLKPGTPPRPKVFNSWSSFPDFIKGYADAELLNFIENVVAERKKSKSDHHGEQCGMAPTLAELIDKNNKYLPAIPMEVVVDYFSKKLSQLNKHKQPLLSELEIAAFINQAFVNDVPKAKFMINYTKNNRLRVIREIFFGFWDMAARKYNETKPNIDLYKSLITDNFSNLGKVDKDSFRAPDPETGRPF